MIISFSGSASIIFFPFYHPSITIQRHTKSITTCETWNRIPDHRKFTYSKRRERARNVHIPLQRSQEVSLNDRSPTLTFPHKLVISGGDAKQIFISFIIILQRTVTITWEVLSFTYRSGEATAPPWAPPEPSALYIFLRFFVQFSWWSHSDKGAIGQLDEWDLIGLELIHWRTMGAVGRSQKSIGMDRKLISVGNRLC